MKKVGLVVLVGVIIMLLTSFAYAADPIATAPKKSEGVAGNDWKKPEVSVEQEFGALPPGIEKRGGDIPGKGKHLGWGKGKHKGWEKVGTATEKVETTKANVDKIHSAVEDFVSQIQKWLEERPKFGITEEGGVSGYRQEIKSWLDKKPEAPDDIIKEITPSS